MSEKRIVTYADGETMATEVAEWLTAKALAKTGRFAISLSGGSTPQRLYQTLATPAFAKRFPWDRTHVFWGDERFVPHTDKDSNFRMVREALLDHVPLPHANIHPIPCDGSPLEAAAQYQQILQAFYGADALDMARPLFDVTLMGLGEDGHTASLFPGSPALDETVAWVVAVHDPSVSQPRITLTYAPFACSGTVAFLAEGSKKAATLRRVLAGDRALPAARVTAIGDLVWFTDEKAHEK